MQHVVESLREGEGAGGRGGEGGGGGGGGEKRRIG